ncbi:C1 family peptidase [Maridesulfovibrio sp. FT414]|uniref:C1 family peptidase n=1 Tax=Maridesulfovibrio sp. FT414 TaxID=2979469 RepID=UPI003D80931D
MATGVSQNRVLNCLKSRNTDSDWTIDSARNSGVLVPGPIPKSVDLRENWWDVGDQGQSGACVGWALADSVLRWHFVKAGRIGDDEKLSVRFIWMASKEFDDYVTYPTTFIERSGTNLKAALMVARKYGIVTDSVLPFSLGSLYRGKETDFYSIASRLRLAGYYNLGRNLDDWKEWISKCGPVLTRLDVDSTWHSFTSHSDQMDSYYANTAQYGHAVALVGYDENRFIIRNSWGSNRWGHAGFGYASMDYVKEAFTEAYGVSI